MQSKRRIIITIILLFVLGIVYYFNSDYYLLMLAKKERDQKVKEFNAIEKSVLMEGSYIYYRPLKQTISKINQFGKNVEYEVDKGYEKISFSFTDDELIIDYPSPWPDNSRNYYRIASPSDITTKKEKPVYNHVKEILRFSKQHEFSPIMNSWVFYVTSWVIIDVKTNKVVENVFELNEYNTKENINIVYLTVEPKVYDSYFYAPLKAFGTVGNHLYISEQIDSYHHGLYPQYATNYSYPKIDIDINSYKKRSSWEDLFKEFFSKKDKTEN